MPPLPSINDFIPFAEAVSSLGKGELRCIWHLPDKRRRCLVEITTEERETALQLARHVIASCQTTGEPAIQDIIDIAEHRCCGRWHRNKLWGSGLSQKLADRWLDELHALMAQSARPTEPPVKQETLVKQEQVVSVNVQSIPLTPPSTPPSARVITPPRTATPTRTPARTPARNLPPTPPSTTRPVAFAKHQLLDWDTLQSRLLSDLDSRASKEGSIYFYTHRDDVFLGMIKIGYTSRRQVSSRLLEWAECGHGSPVLLGAFPRVRHPERVETLIHLELERCWHALRWCSVHAQSHIEWFRVEYAQARDVARGWSEWMDRANPYDRRGKLTDDWVSHIAFLVEHDCPITAEAMTLIMRIEEGSAEVLEFIDDEVLRKSGLRAVKREEEES